MATINLGAIKFKWQGAYNAGTAYTVDDVVSYQGSSYICILASTGNLPTNATYWEQMSAKGTDGTNGTDGTDLTTTLTTQGDIVYRDASGLARLGAGTSGQALITGGAGANPSWGDVSSGLDLVTEGTFTNANQLVFANTLWDATKYRFHEIYCQLSSNSNASGNASVSYSSNGGSSYFSTGLSSHGWEFNSASASPGATRFGDNVSECVIAGDGINTNTGALWMIWSGLNQAVQKQFQSIWVRANHDATYRMKANNMFGLIDSTDTSSTLRITGFTAFNISGTYKVFGRK